MHRGSNVVHKTRTRQLGRPNASAERGLGFVDADRAAGAGERDRRGKTVRSGTDNDRVDWSAVTHRVTSSVERLFLHPIEAAADEKEFVEIVERHRHLDALSIDLAVEREFRRRRPLIGEVAWHR